MERKYVKLDVGVAFMFDQEKKKKLFYHVTRYISSCCALISGGIHTHLYKNNRECTESVDQLNQQHDINIEPEDLDVTPKVRPAGAPTILVQWALTQGYR